MPKDIYKDQASGHREGTQDIHSMQTSQKDYLSNLT